MKSYTGYSSCMTKVSYPCVQSAVYALLYMPRPNRYKKLYGLADTFSAAFEEKPVGDYFWSTL